MRTSDIHNTHFAGHKHKQPWTEVLEVDQLLYIPSNFYFGKSLHIAQELGVEESRGNATLVMRP